MSAKRLVDYGDFFVTYHGTGTLRLAGGSRHRCRFEAGQGPDGRCMLACNFDTHEADVGDDAEDGESDHFEGLTVDGARLSSIGPIQKVSSRYESSKGWVSAVYRLREFEVTADEGPSGLLRFGVTNFGPRPPGRLPVRLGPDVPDEIALVPLPAAEPVDDGYRVTCEIEVRLGNDAGRQRAERAVSDLCRILSVAQGTMAQWIYLDEIGDDGRLLRRRHSGHYTKPYQSHELVEIGGFVEAAHKGYVRNDERYDLSRMTILGYLDAIAQDDLLERRAMKLVVVVETLKSIFLKAPDATIREFIIDDEEEWATLNSDLRKAIKKVLECVGVPSEKRALIYKKIGELRRMPFKVILLAMFDDLDFRPAPEDLALFVKCRDSLIHVGEFYAASEEEQRRFYQSGVTSDDIRGCASPSRRCVAQYFFLKNFVDRIILALLGYEGPYRDHRLDSPVEREW